MWTLDTGMEAGIEAMAGMEAVAGIEAGMVSIAPLRLTMHQCPSQCTNSNSQIPQVLYTVGIRLSDKSSFQMVQ